MGESQRHCAKQDKPLSKGSILYDFVWHSQKDRTIMMEMGIARVRVGEGVTKGKVLRSFGAVYSPVSLLWWDLSLNVKVLVA